jgi:Protein of unknown function (DUF3025)
MKPGLDAVDWQRPWLAPFRAVGQQVSQRLQAGATLPEALNLPGAPRRFVPQSELPTGEPYEAFIARSGCVPTRENLHDFFNGIVWHSQPALKARLNQLQAATMARDGVGPQRGALRDALTLFDENGALLSGPPALQAALQARDWQTLFVSGRALWAQAQLHIVGHALLEQLSLAPRKGLTAHVLVADALALDEDAWRAKPFLPLPVLGVPGWWAANDDAGFYADASVFRPARAQTLATPLAGTSRP